jgi:hypothetical protein
MLLFFAFAAFATYAISRAGQFGLKILRPAHRQLVLRCIFDVGVILTVVLIAFWLLNTPTTTSIS